MYGKPIGGIILPGSFAAFIALLAVCIAVSFAGFGTGPSLYGAHQLYSIIDLVPLFLPLVLVAFLARSLERDAKMLSVVLYALAVAFFIFIAFSGLVYLPSTIHLDDEEFITLAAAASFANGHNPYTQNFSGALASNVSVTVTQPTRTLQGQIVGTLQYPALSFLVSVPFALLQNYNIVHFRYQGVYILVALFTILLVLVASRLISLEQLKRPPVLAALFLIISLAIFASFIDTLMLAVFLLALYWSRSRYLWIALGVLASLQQMMWVVVAMFIIYSFRNCGAKAGLRNIAGAAAVFLIFNGLFIAAGPSSFIGNILLTSNGGLIHNPYPAFGYLVVSYLPAMPVGPVVFYLSIIAVLVASAYLNMRNMIPLLGLVPLMFLGHGTPTYYVFFISAIVLALYIPEKAGVQMAPRTQFSSLSGPSGRQRRPA